MAAKAGHSMPENQDAVFRAPTDFPLPATADSKIQAIRSTLDIFGPTPESASNSLYYCNRVSRFHYNGGNLLSAIKDQPEIVYSF